MQDIIELYNKFQRNQSDDNLKDLYDALAHSKFLLPFNSKSGKDSLITIEDSNKIIYFPIFLDFNAVKRGVLSTLDKNIKFADVSVDTMLEILENNPKVTSVVLNPYDINLVISKELMRVLSSINNSAKVMYGKPEENVEVFENKLSNILDTVQEIKSAYFTKIIIKKESSYLIVLEGFEVLNKDIFEKISNIIVEQEIIFNLPLDMISSDSELGKDIMENQKPFYTR